jgi:pyruvate/2-oxoglutarate/acetoin dehydrogenase E1 component
MIVSRVSENVIDALDAPVIRVAAKDTFLPAVDDLCSAVERVLAY